MLLQLHVLLQALQDILSYELGLPLDGLEPGEDPEDIYFDSIALIARYPKLLSRWKTKNKLEWLKELNYVGEDLGLETRRYLQGRRGFGQQHAITFGFA